MKNEKRYITEIKVAMPVLKAKKILKYEQYKK